MLPIDLIERFNRYVKPNINGCHLWIGSKNEKGYGNFYVGIEGKTICKAHRVSFAIHNKLNLSDVPSLLRHTCDCPACVNPFHLLSGTSADNVKDMFDRGRAPNRKGSNNQQSILTEENVDVIRALISSGETNIKIGEKFNVHHSTISQIRVGRSWGHYSSPIPS